MASDGPNPGGAIAAGSGGGLTAASGEAPAAAPAAAPATAALMAPAADEEEVDCAICFETLESVGGPVPLPCECRVAYCSRCWDRALAASMSASGRATCPSCRAPMHVDFDPDLGRLCFARAPAPPAGSQEKLEDNWRSRLYTQAKPLQIRLLRRYGEALGFFAPQAASAGSANGQRGAAIAAMAAALEPSARGGASSCYAPPTSASAAAALAAVSPGGEPPVCICGARLACVGIRDRVLAFVYEGSPVPPLPSQLEALMSSPPIVCDICCRQVRTSQVWTCENGRRTVLHAAAYDVCEACFAWHAFGEEGGDEDGGTSCSEHDDEDGYYSSEPYSD